MEGEELDSDTIANRSEYACMLNEDKGERSRLLFFTKVSSLEKDEY